MCAVSDAKPVQARTPVMHMEFVKTLSADYLRQQAGRCQRLSRNCMDLGTARALRLMAEEYLAEAATLETATPAPEPH